MKGDFLNELSPHLKTKFMEDVIDTIKLLELKELKDFKLGINYEDAECQDIILKTRNKKPEERADIIFKEGLLIIDRYFNYQKKKELIGLLDKVDKKYKKKDEKISRIAYTALLLLEDKEFKNSQLPLLTACLSLELAYMEEELFNDPQYFYNRGLNCLKQDKLEEAEKFFLLEQKICDSHWDSYEGLADVYYKQSRKDDAVEYINKALERIYKYWQDDQEYIDFEVVEEIEEKADEILNRDREKYLKRLCQYACGLLYFLGAAPLDVIIEEIKDIINCKKQFSKEEMLYYLKDEPWIKIDGEVIYLQDIEEPRLIISEISSRGLRQSAPYSLSAIKLAQEGRIKEMFFTQDPDNEDMDEDLKRMTKGELGLVKAYEELRKDITGRKHHDMLINKFLSDHNKNIQEIIDILSYIWNNFPRWEIGGRIPSELSDKRMAEGLRPQLDTHITSFAPSADIQEISKQKIGRNDPCPCGSGKKYKKCCGN